MKKRISKRGLMACFLIVSLILSVMPVYAEENQEIEQEQQIEELKKDGENSNLIDENKTHEKNLTPASYEYFDYDKKADSAYVVFGDVVKEHKCVFMDGLKSGITDSENEFYNERSGELGVRGRKFYKANYVNVQLDEEFCDESDREFLVSIVYYDYGPSEGKFRFEYISETGNANQITLIKSGKIQDWFTKTVYVNDADFTKSFESGANIRLGNNAYNLFKRIEIVNISKLKRENKQTNAVCLTLDEKTVLSQMEIIDENSDEYADANLYKNCDMQSVEEIFSIISGNSNNENKKEYITNLELLKKSFELTGVSYSEEDILKKAYETGIVKSKDLIFDLDSQATYYNLYSVVYNTMFYKNDHNESLVSQMIKRNYFSDKTANSIFDEKFLSEWYRVPKKCEAKIIKDNTTGNTYKYMNIFGNQTWRTYVTMQCWTSDGKSFICGLASGDMYLYNTETEMLQYLDKCLNTGERLHAIMGTDDCVYYFDQDNISSIWKIDTRTLEKTKLADAPESVGLAEPSITNDCNYIGARCSDPYNKFSKPGECISVVYDVKNDEWKFFTHEFDYSNLLTHTQVNPEYPNLVSFAHEIGSGFTASDITDRIWLYDFNTGKSNVMFNQGIRPTNGKAIQGATHELWSDNGKYMYFVNFDITDENFGLENWGKTPGIIRYNIDGSHRKYYYDTDSTIRYFSHCYPTGDDKFVVADTNIKANLLALINTQTNEVFDIAEVAWLGIDRHPYQMHPIVARDEYVVSWAGIDSGVLGIMWMDFTELANKSAKGGNIEINDTVSSVSYENLDCEISRSVKMNKDCYYVKPNNKMYIDINENIIDCTDGKIKLTFEYYDNSIQPLIITYTSGVKSESDHANVENAEKRLSRKATRKWKKAEVIIESGNFEDIGLYDSDLNIKGLCSAAYIRNVTAQKID